MTDTQKYKLLPTGGDTYSEIITKSKYYVDKTLYLRSVLLRMEVRFFYLQDHADLAKPYLWTCLPISFA